MIELQQFPDINAPTLQGQVQQMKDYLYRFVQNYNIMAQEINRKLEKESNHGK